MTYRTRDERRAERTFDDIIFGRRSSTSRMFPKSSLHSQLRNSDANDIDMAPGAEGIRSSAVGPAIMLVFAGVALAAVLVLAAILIFAA